MAQMQKHWIQAMFNEDTYTPFPYFYDVTGWSNPLLYNLAGGFSGAELSPVGTQAGVDEPVGDGGVVVFTFDPNFRAFTDGT